MGLLMVKVYGLWRHENILWSPLSWSRANLSLDNTQRQLLQIKLSAGSQVHQVKILETHKSTVQL